MHHRTLGSTPVMVSEIVLGTWGLAAKSYGKLDAALFDATVRAAWDAGVTTYDLAGVWGDGESERRTANALGDHLSDAVLITRVGQNKIDGRVVGQFDPTQIIRDVDLSLARLGRQSIDVLLLHNPPAKLLGSSYPLKGLLHLAEAGKVRAWGASVASVEDGRLAVRMGAKVLCIAHNLLAPDDFNELAGLAKDEGIGLLARSTLAYGMLAGAWTKETKFGEDDHRARRWEPEAFAARLERVEKLRFLVKEPIADLATAALRFALASPLIAGAIVGARTPEQIQHAARASVGMPAMSPEDLGALAKLAAAP